MTEMFPVDSTNVEAIGHDPLAQELYVRFVKGPTYVYHGVPEDVYQELMAATSKGSYLNRIIKPNYQFTKL